jgi:hypothetical protein
MWFLGFALPKMGRRTAFQLDKFAKEIIHIFIAHIFGNAADLLVCVQ